jgi:hypothetical protein
LTFLFVLLWTGVTPKLASHLVIARNWKLLGDEPFAIVAHQGGFHSRIRIRVPFPEYRTQQAAVPSTVKCQAQEYVCLDDSVGLGSIVNTYAELQRRTGSSFKLFDNPQRIKANAKALLKAWDPTGRLTIQKITTTLYARIMRLTGKDAVVATMITGRKNRLSDVAMFYACRKLSRVRYVYQKAVSELRDEIEEEKPNGWIPVETEKRGFKPWPKAAGKPANSIFVSRRLCPRTDAVRAALQKVIRPLQKRPSPSRTDRAWITFHNLYTFYTMWFFAMAIGVRKIVTPYIDVSEVSPINHVARLRDKDGESGAKAKLVWIPDGVLQQMEFYRSHVTSVCMRFQLQTALPCFFLGKKAQIYKVRPKTLFPYVSRFLPGFPVDIHRRFIFNCLLDDGCPPEVVRIWMGHAIAGEEWWGEDATFSHRIYREHLSRHLIRILDSLQFKPMRGL